MRTPWGVVRGRRGVPWVGAGCGGVALVGVGRGSVARVGDGRARPLPPSLSLRSAGGDLPCSLPSLSGSDSLSPLWQLQGGG